MFQLWQLLIEHFVLFLWELSMGINNYWWSCRYQTFCMLINQLELALATVLICVTYVMMKRVLAMICTTFCRYLCLLWNLNICYRILVRCYQLHNIYCLIVESVVLNFSMLKFLWYCCAKFSKHFTELNLRRRKFWKPGSLVFFEPKMDVKVLSNIRHHA